MTKYSNQPDNQLINLLKKGDKTAFHEIYMRYESLLYLYAYRKLLDKEEARDIVQEVFITLWDKREMFELKTFLSGYLYKAVLNRVFNLLKHQKIIRQYADTRKAEIDIDDKETDFLIQEKEITHIIEREISAMPPRMREIYELKRKQYLSTREIATRLELSELTVSTQLKRALKHLKVRLGILVSILIILLS